MITEAKVSDQTVVFENTLSKFLNPGFILEMVIAFQQTPVEFNDLT
jgi:hypothetical protein